MDRYEITTLTIYLIVLKISSRTRTPVTAIQSRLFANAATRIFNRTRSWSIAWSDFRANYYFIILISISCLIHTKYYVRRKYFKLINAFVVYIPFAVYPFQLIYSILIYSIMSNFTCDHKYTVTTKMIVLIQAFN